MRSGMWLPKWTEHAKMGLAMRSLSCPGLLLLLGYSYGLAAGPWRKPAIGVGHVLVNG